MKAAARQIRDAQVAQVYASNQSLRSTAKLFGISHEGVRKILTAQGVTIAPPCTWNNPVGAKPLRHQPQPGECAPIHSPGEPFSASASPLRSVERPGLYPHQAGATL